MAIVVGRAALLALAAGAAEGSSVAWFLGGSGQTCDQACRAVDRTCLPTGWPTSVATMHEVAASAFHLCDNIQKEAAAGAMKYAPYYNPSSSGGGVCYFSDTYTEAEPCAVEPANGGNFRARFCPCSGAEDPSGGSGSSGSASVKWLTAATTSLSCDDVCQANGGLCGSTLSVYPTSKNDMMEVGRLSNSACTEYPSTVKNTAPIVLDNKCYWFFQSQGAVFPACGAVEPSAKRICPCYGTSLGSLFSVLPAPAAAQIVEERGAGGAAAGAAAALAVGVAAVLGLAAWTRTAKQQQVVNTSE